MASRIQKNIDIVCDTNVFYYIASSLVDPHKLKQNGCCILASAINLLEISSKLTEITFEERRNAARAVMKYVDKLLDDPESHLAYIWGLKRGPFNKDLFEGFKAIANANNINELYTGVADFKEQKIRKVNLDLARDFVEYFGQTWVEDIEKAIEDIIPNYAERRKNNKMRYLNKRERFDFENFISDPIFYEKVLLTTKERINPYLKNIPSKHEIKKARQKLKPYIKAYSRYLFKLATEFTPTPNDRADLELFIYLQKGRKLLTFDNKWIKIAKECSLNDFLFNIKSPKI